MAHGAPDYANVVKPEFTHRVDDLGELAARQSNLVSLERRGETVFIEDFSYGIYQWSTGFNGIGGEVALNASHFVSSGFSCRMRSGSTGSRYASILKYFPYLALSKTGLEFRFEHDLRLDYFYISLYNHNGVDEKRAFLKYKYLTEVIEVWNEDLGWTPVLDNVDAPYPGTYFSLFKLVVDFENGVYQRVYFNNFNADLTDISLSNASYASDPYLLISIFVYGIVNYVSTFYIDNIIITRNE